MAPNVFYCSEFLMTDEFWAHSLYFTAQFLSMHAHIFTVLNVIKLLVTDKVSLIKLSVTEEVTVKE